MEVMRMARQKGLNKNRNHHDNLSYSGKDRMKNDSYANSYGILDALTDSLSLNHNKPYGKGKHSKGGKPKQKHW